MDNIDIQDNYLKILSVKEYEIDEIIGLYEGEFPVTCKGIKSITHLISTLATLKNKILLDSTLSVNDMAYLKTRLEKQIDDYETIKINDNKYFMQKGIRVYEATYGAPPIVENKKIDLNDVNPTYLNYIEKYSKHKFEITNTLITELTEKIDFVHIKSESNKLNLNLSVADISLFFRLLDDEKIFNTKHKTEIYRFISQSFSTNKQESISEASVKNKFITPDNTSIGNIETLLIRMRQNLKNI
ncbi:hypothetical protein ACUNWD_06945 [Sunxiuqinia sp. A32]|uniref:hypothetical protein n=1 Tax=Sunxiuqinia sp. A32 TaxID=3461496 RepID=UPI004045D521